MKIVITGPKCCGKSTVGREVTERLGIAFVETDTLVERAYERDFGEAAPFYEICEKLGEPEFREYEKQAVKEAAETEWCVVSVGGSTLLDPDSRKKLRKHSIVVLLRAEPALLWERLVKIGRSKYLRGDSPREFFEKHVTMKMEALEPFADIVLDVTDAQDVGETLIDRLAEFMAAVCRAPNTLGEVIRLTTFGESHGPAIGAVLDGIRPGVEISPEDIQKELDRRRPGQSRVSTPRSEADKVKILSGVFEGKTTGAPIAMMIQNRDHDSTKYDVIRELLRPGHADFTFWKKYGIRDHKGGGRSSGRETAGRVAGGAVAKKILAERGVHIAAHSIEIGGVRAKRFDGSAIESNSVRCADREAAEMMERAILEAHQKGESVGGIVELRIEGVPAGLGDPVFGKLDARLAGAICSLGAVKGIEFGDGFAAAKANGSEFNDQMENGRFLTNRAGGVLGGISTGQDIIVTLAIKPTPSISKPQRTIDKQGKNHTIEIEGRHDPCIAPRIIPAIESMAALVILDAWEIQQRLRGIDLK